MAIQEAVLRPRDILKITGLSRSTIWRLEKRGDFPSRRQISDSCVGWLSSEVEEWLRSRSEVRRSDSHAI